MLDWKIYYGDRSTVSNLDCSPEQVPKRNVQGILVRDDNVGRRVERQTDNYVWKENGWVGVDQFGLFDYLIDPGFKIVLFGRTIGYNEYSALIDLMVHDPDFPVKSGFTPLERRTG